MLSAIVYIISILAPYVGSDGCYFKKFFFQRNFNSRSLREERYITGQSNKDIIVISILAPSVGSDLCAYTTH